MSQRFPQANYYDITKVAKKLGFIFFRQAKGSHEIWRRPDGRYLTVHNHGKKMIKRKTFKGMLDDLEVSAEKFVVLRKGKK